MKPSTKLVIAPTVLTLGLTLGQPARGELVEFGSPPTASLPWVMGSRARGSSLDNHRRICASTEIASETIIDSCTAVILSRREASKDLARAYFHRGTAFISEFNLEKALGDYDVAIRLDPKNADYLLNKCWLNSYDGQYDHAVSDCMKVVEIRPSHPHIFILLGNIYARKGDYNNAIDAYSNATYFERDLAVAYNGLAWAYLWSGNLNQALDDVNRSLHLESNFAEAIDTRARIYQKLGYRDKALADFRLALSINPNIISIEAQVYGCTDSSECIFHAENELAWFILIDQTGQFFYKIWTFVSNLLFR